MRVRKPSAISLIVLSAVLLAFAPGETDLMVAQWEPARPAPANGLVGVDATRSPLGDPSQDRSRSVLSPRPVEGPEPGNQVRLAAKSSAGDWRIETIDSEGYVGEYTSLALDDAARPHVSYWDETHNDLKYAWHNGAEWQIETVDSEGMVGYSNSIELDRSGRPHISYYDNTNGDLKYAWHDGMGWQIETVDSNGWVGVDSSLALDAAGQPHISYHGNNDLKYAWHDGTGWRIETVDSGGYVGCYTSLVVDSAGQSHISYWDNRDLRYALRSGPGWWLETVDSTGDVGWQTSLALDGAGWPHISYFDYTNSDLKHAWYDAGWQIEVVDSEGWVGSDTSLALDKTGRPHISYFDGNNCDLRHAWHDGTGWRIETVDAEGCVGTHTSLALDEVGQPHISYHDLGNRSLKYAQLMLPHLAVNKQAMPLHDLRNSDLLTYTLTLSGPGLNVRLWDPLPSTVYYITDSMTGTVTPPAIYNPTTRTVIWQGTLLTDIVQMIRFQVTPGISGTDALSLALPIVNTAWLSDTEGGRTVSATVIVNAKHRYLPIIVRAQ